MPTLRRMTLEFDDRTISLEGAEAEKWRGHCADLAAIAAIHGGMNPFDSDPVSWIPSVSIADLCDHLQGHLAQGASIDRQDGLWHLFREDGEGIASGETIEAMLRDLVWKETLAHG